MREFVELEPFIVMWKKLGLTEEDLIEFESILLENPDCGNIIQGTGGVRKVRVSLPGKGKSGGARVLYVDLIYFEKLYLLSIYSKSKKENITDREKKELKSLVQILEEQLRG